jgi:hypothetical protein
VQFLRRLITETVSEAAFTLISKLCSKSSFCLLYQPRMIDDDDDDDDDCGAVGGMRIGRGNRSTRRKPAPVPVYHHRSHIT